MIRYECNYQIEEQLCYLIMALMWTTENQDGEVGKSLNKQSKQVTTHQTP